MGKRRKTLYTFAENKFYLTSDKVVKIISFGIAIFVCIFSKLI